MPLMTWFASLARRWFARPAADGAELPPPAHASAPAGASAPPCSLTSPVPCTRPLRVWRVIDGSSSAGMAGRLVMAGRLADVCAELDRLAALEAAAA